jgi:hypothetical protein
MCVVILETKDGKQHRLDTSSEGRSHEYMLWETDDTSDGRWPKLFVRDFDRGVYKEVSPWTISGPIPLGGR